MGLAMGVTAIGIIYSPWGQRSGAHINPALTLTFFRLGKIAPWDAVFYITAQFIGGLAGILLMLVIIGPYLTHPNVEYVVTVPGSWGVTAAFLAELLISFLLMTLVLFTTNTRRLAHFTGMFAGMLVATYIIVESPLSGMSINPARTFASALPARVWTGFWLYLVAPPLGMLLAAELYRGVKGIKGIICAKLHHPKNAQPCIFLNCGYLNR